MSSVMSALEVVFSPLSTYKEGLSKAVDPEELDDFLRNEQPVSEFMALFALGSLLLSTAISIALNYSEGPMRLVGTPGLNELLSIVVGMVGAAISAVLIYVIAKLLGGSGTLRQRLTACLYVSVGVLPLLTLVEAVWSKFNSAPIPSSGYVSVSLFMILLAAKLHSVSVVKLGVAVFGLSLILGVTGALVLIWLF